MASLRSFGSAGRRSPCSLDPNCRRYSSGSVRTRRRQVEGLVDKCVDGARGLGCRARIQQLRASAEKLAADKRFFARQLAEGGARLTRAVKRKGELEATPAATRSRRQEEELAALAVQLPAWTQAKGERKIWRTTYTV